MMNNDYNAAKLQEFARQQAFTAQSNSPAPFRSVPRLAKIISGVKSACVVLPDDDLLPREPGNVVIAIDGGAHVVIPSWAIKSLLEQIGEEK